MESIGLEAMALDGIADWLSRHAESHQFDNAPRLELFEDIPAVLFDGTLTNVESTCGHLVLRPINDAVEDLALSG